MPRGTHHQVTGLLLASARGLVVELPGGGAWLVAAGRGSHRLLGRRVIVEGVRTVFDELWPKRISEVRLPSREAPQG